MEELRGNGSVKRSLSNIEISDDEEFLGFNAAEQNDSRNMIQNIKKICTDSSSDETTSKRHLANRTTDILDPVYKLPFKYGWKRELVLRAEPTMSKEKGEVYYITPSGKKLRTRHEIQVHLHDDLTIHNFTLVKEAIGASPDDEIIRPAKYYNYARRSNIDPVVNESSIQTLGKRVPKPKMPKGASPPPPMNVHNTSLSSPSQFSSLSTSSNNKIFSKDNHQDFNKSSNSSKKLSVGSGKGSKQKGDARCTIHCLSALGKIPQLQCKICLCLFHHECAKASENQNTTFICENCNIKFSNSSQNALKKHHQLQPPTNKTHNFESHPQTVITYNGKKFIMYESDESNVNFDPKTNREVAQKTEAGSKTSNSRNDTLHSSVSPFNFSSNFLQNVSIGFDVLLHTFQYLKVQELQRAARVCRMWNLVANSSILWRTVRMKNSSIHDWDGFVKTLKRNGTTHLDLRKVLMGNQEEAWRDFSAKIAELDQLRGIDLCRCTPNIVENLFNTNPNLRVINAISLKDERINLENLSSKNSALEELRLRSTHANGIVLLNVDFSPFINMRHLSLTTVENLASIFENNFLAQMTNLVSLELGNCDQLNDQQFSDNLMQLNQLGRLRIEKGSQNFNINLILETIAKHLPNLHQLELINCDVKNNFVEAIKECQQLQRLLLIPTYVSQSAATNFMIMQGVMSLTNLTSIHWVVTNELLRVTELYLDQSDNSQKGKKSPDKHNAVSTTKLKDCIPVLKPVPGKEDEEEDDSNNVNKQQQVEIVALKIVESILSKKLGETKVKLLKVPHANTWRQSLEL
ncbi:hypothetical protein PVAND_003738 [Polypedilum vanderplanki]|uniref:MBD domain-containing protein n=1 Tax=Polypedilum vanderplanki TaxID=319348 RepID=A0A9J6BW23_POLVA|nr:hypothetical protein PVAND_003738 [Polypedilum vanderplanki]